MPKINGISVGALGAGAELSALNSNTPLNF